MSPRPRSSDKHLPRRVYKKHGAFFLVSADNKWIRLGKTEAELYASLARMADDENVAGMDALFHRYEEKVIPTKAERTQADNLKELANLRKSFGHMAPEDVKPVHVYAYLDARGESAPTRANREIALLSHVFTFAVRWGVVEANPCRDVRKLEEKPRDRYVEDWEYRAVFALASPMIQAAMELASATGIRQGDLLALKWSDLREDGIPITQAKTGKKQLMEWSPRTLAAVELLKGIDRPVSSFYLFAVSTGSRISSSGFQTAWQRLMDKALESGAIQNRFTFHDLRAKAGSDADNPTELLGHQSPATTRRIYIRKPTKVRPIG